jgi:transcriptional regulator with XRE-family HTH domain
VTGKTPNSIDRRIGNAIRRYRTARRMSQHYLAASIGVRFQQLQKYEGAVNRVPASRLFRIARVLEVPIGHFFEEAAKI